MIFDRLWRAERRASKEDSRIHDKYEPLMEAAEKEKNEHDYNAALSAMLYETELNDEPEVIRTERLVRQARKLGITLPAKPARQVAEMNADPDWSFNHHNGNWYFTERKELELRLQIRREADERFAHLWSRVGGVLSALTLVVLAANLYIYYRQAKIMGTQADIMQKTLPVVGQQADAATSAAHTAEATLQESQKTFRIEQRPYLVPETPTFAVSPTIPGPASSNITIKNIGKTPAVRMMSAIVLIRHKAQKITPGAINKISAFLEGNFQELTRQLDTAIPNKYAELVRQDLAPNAAVFSTRELKPPLSLEEIPELAPGELTLFLIGVTRYSDAYSGNYETQFCYIYYGSPGIWHNCDSHNFIK
jgi:hypothetical protein